MRAEPVQLLLLEGVPAELLRGCASPEAMVQAVLRAAASAARAGDVIPHTPKPRTAPDRLRAVSSQEGVMVGSEFPAALYQLVLGGVELALDLLYG